MAAAGLAEAGDFVMRTKEFLGRIDHDCIVNAIREAEAKTSGEIRVFVQRGKLKADALPVAQKKFHRLGLDKTRERNAVLIFVAPRARKFAVIGDQAIHEKCGEAFWQSLVDEMRRHFRDEKLTEALIHGIREIGAVLSAHFPRTSTSSNKLSDDVVEG